MAEKGNLKLEGLDLNEKEDELYPNKNIDKLTVCIERKGLNELGGNALGGKEVSESRIKKLREEKMRKVFGRKTQKSQKDFETDPKFNGPKLILGDGNDAIIMLGKRNKLENEIKNDHSQLKFSKSKKK